MKKLIALAVLFLSFAALAQTAHQASGVVKRVDASKGKVTIQHGPVPDLQWPAMTMTFSVQDKALLDRLEKGKKVDFKFLELGGSYVVTEVK